MDLFAIHACQEIKQKWSAQMGKMTLRVDDLEYARNHHLESYLILEFPEANSILSAPT